MTTAAEEEGKPPSERRSGSGRRRRRASKADDVVATGEDGDDGDDDTKRVRSGSGGKRKRATKTAAAAPVTVAAASSSSASSSPPPPASHFKTSEDEKTIRLALHKSPFFTCLDEEQIERFVAVAERRQYDEGEIVILEGCVDEYDDDEEEEDRFGNGTGGRSASVVRGRLSDKRETVKVPIHSGPADDYEISSEDDCDNNNNNNNNNKKIQNDGETDGGTATETSVSTADDGTPVATASGDNDVDRGGDGEKVEEEALNQGNGGKVGGNIESMTIPFQLGEQFPRSIVKDRPVALQHQITTTTHPSMFGSTSTSTETSYSSKPPPPRSGTKRALYIVKSGRADVWYHPGFNPASLGPGSVFGEGGFLFGRQHSASVIAGLSNDQSHTEQKSQKPKFECWVVDYRTFRNYVLPSNNMKQLYQKYASVKIDGDSDAGSYAMTMQDFVRAIEQQESTAIALRDPLVGLRIANTYNLLSSNKTKRKLGDGTEQQTIDLPEFCIFHLLMSRPDPEIDIAFLLMDSERTGQIRIEDVERFLHPVFPDINLQSEFFKRYFGHDDQRGGRSGVPTMTIREHNFSQFFADLQREVGQQAFLKAVSDHGFDGYLAQTDFVRVLKTACGWRLPEGVADRLEEIYCNPSRQSPRDDDHAAALETERRDIKSGKRYFAYGDFIAFQEVLAILPGICNVIDRAQEIKKEPISPDDFKVANRVLGLGGRLSRRQVDIIFALFDLNRDGYISHEDTVQVCGVDFAERLVPVRGRSGALTFAPAPKFRKPGTDAISAEGPLSGGGAIDDLALQVGHFSLSAIAGALGPVALYPLELIKTRLMNQRITKDGAHGRLYANSLDCFRQVFRAEGIAGLYRGMTPQLLGVAPEKAIKLRVNDLLRKALGTHDEGTGALKINLPLEMLAGACAGACQLLVTNPMEIVKTRLILQGETSELLRRRGLTPPPTQNFRGVVKDLGFLGLYRGAAACLLRDVPFSAIYFPSYAACKSTLASRRDSNRASLTDLLVAGTAAAVPAALFTTPADVIRVRLQAVAQRPGSGEPNYTGMRDCATQIYETEGPRGFFRGSGPRVLRTAPQFGITLLAYEQITSRLGVSSSSSAPGGGNNNNRPPTNAPVDPHDYRSVFPAPSP